MKPIDLSDEQRRIIGEYVANTPVRWRERYTGGVTALLAREPVISNAIVLRVCADIAKAMMVGGAAPELGDDN